MELGDDDDGDAPFRSPPSPDDRLWRHPSELGASAPARRAPWAAAMVSGLLGSVLTVGLLAATGLLDREVVERPVTVREAVQPTGRERQWPGVDIVRIAAAAAPAIVRVEVTGDEPGVGSGVLYRDDGHVVTNAHVVDEASDVDVVLADGRKADARVVGTDPDTDVAVLAIDAEGTFPTALLGRSDDLSVGEMAIAIGSPLGLRGPASVTAGVVSALGRQIETQDGRELHDMIQTDAAIAAGSSGGALLDASGAVVGITTAYAVSEVGVEGLGFATPIELVRAVADELVAHGRVRQVWLGIRGSGDGEGVRLTEVVEASPAQLAGLRPGDVLVQLGDRPVDTMQGLRSALRRMHPGDEVPVVYVRDGERQATTVTLVERDA